MVLVSVKGAELTPDSWKLKAQIVFRGDSSRDECGMSAVFDDLYSSSPSSLEGLNTAIVVRFLESHGVSMSGAIKAYVQSELKSPMHATSCCSLIWSQKTRSTSRIFARDCTRPCMDIVLSFLVPTFRFHPQRFGRTGIPKLALCFLLPAFASGLMRLC